MAKETFMLALPSMISMLLGVVFIYADRFFLKHYLGDSAVGIYFDKNNKIQRIFYY